MESWSPPVLQLLTASLLEPGQNYKLDVGEVRQRDQWALQGTN